MSEEKISSVLKKEPKLVVLRNDKATVFIGDTHGDLYASKRIVKKWPVRYNRLVFLGDYVDRGDYSKENLEYLLGKKEENPGDVILTLGNHDTYTVIGCHPADFWESLDYKEREKYSNLLLKLPLAVSIDGIIALHGALPNLENVEEINDITIEEHDRKFFDTIWGDFKDDSESEGELNGHGRPQFGEKEFERRMKNIKKNVIIRGHDYHAPLSLYNGRCITLFTTNAYKVPRRVAILGAGKTAKTIKDLKIQEI